MIRHWISSFTPKRIIIFVVIIAVAIYILWYVVDALEGLDADFRPDDVTETQRGDVG